MAIILDPDDLNQGSSTAVSDGVWGTPSGLNVQITSALSEMPALAAGEFFEVRDHSNSANNGLYIVVTVNTSTSDYSTTKITGAAPAAAGSEAVTFLGATGASTEKSVMIDTQGYGLYILEQGNVIAADGVDAGAFYSFLKEEWKTDTTLPPYQFPIIAIDTDAGKYEFVEDWYMADNGTHSIRTTKVYRNGGWAEVDSSDVIKKKYAGIVTLGTFEDSANDTAYYQLGDDATDTTAATDFEFAGPVNQAVLVYNQNVGPLTTTGVDFVDGGGGNDQIVHTESGNFVTLGYKIGGQVTVLDAETPANDGTYTILDIVTTSTTNDTLEIATASLTADVGDVTCLLAVDNRNSIKLKLRVRDADPNGKTFDQANLISAGAAALDNFVFKFPLGNQTDIKISETDANIGSNSPYTQIIARYFDQAFNIEVDSATNRDFGIVIDVGTHSGVDGSFSAGGSTLTSLEGGIPTDATYVGGTITIHEGTDEGTTYNINGTPTATTVSISPSTFTAAESNISFTLQRATPVSATAEEIYEKVQYLLRQASDIDTTDQTVVGKTAGELMIFEGDNLKCGTKLPDNPNGGGSGVKIMGFDANDTNRLFFTDNTGTARQYPFVAAGTINWNTFLENDANGFYWVFFTYTERFTNTGFGLSAPSGSTATLDSSVTDLTAELSSGDYIRLTGFANSDLNGIYVLTGAPAGTGPWTAAVRRVDGTTLVAEAAGASVSLDKNPVGSPDAIIVNNASAAPITGSTFGASSTSFDFDYVNNVQGGRTADTDAAITLRAIGYDTAQWVETTGVISKATGLSYTLVAAQERNYDNP